MKLELKHISPYLPYGLNGEFKLSEVINPCKNEIKTKVLTDENCGFFCRYCKPILHPLSDYRDINSLQMSDLNFDLTDQISISDLANKKIGYWQLPYATILLMSEAHIDFQDLISQGLAIDINTLPEFQSKTGLI